MITIAAIWFLLSPIAGVLIGKSIRLADAQDESNALWEAANGLD